jgi:hypothetical protein
MILNNTVLFSTLNSVNNHNNKIVLDTNLQELKHVYTTFAKYPEKNLTRNSSYYMIDLQIREQKKTPDFPPQNE